MTLRVGILGAGRIAQGFDAPGDADVRSLAHAVQRATGLELAGFFDARPERAEAAEKKWACPPTPRDRAQWLREGFDVFLIATPAGCHERDLSDVLAVGPRAVLLEKPPTSVPHAGADALRAAREAGVAVVVNYPRRWHSGTAVASERIVSGALGAPLSLECVASGPLLEGAVHALDLWCWLFGSDWVVRGTRGGLELVRNGSRVALNVHALPVAYYTFEMRVRCEEGSIELGGTPERLALSTPRPHPLFRDFRVLSPELETEVDAEPLLVRSLEALLALAGDAAALRQHADRELGSWRFCSEVACAVGEGGR